MRMIIPNCREFFQHCKNELLSLYEEKEAEAIIFWLIDEKLSISKVQIALRESVEIRDSLHQDFMTCLSRLKQGEPIQYVLGYGYFMGERILVNSSVLIPRPETESIVKLLEKVPKNSRVLDIGTGSGCIAILAKKIRSDLNITGWELSKEALAVAKANARHLDVEVNFQELDVFRPWPQDQWDIIVSNPPYIPESDKSLMRENVLNHEPAIALFVPDGDPLRFYQRILENGREALQTSGSIFFEVHELLAAKVVGEAHAAGYEKIEVVSDMFGKERFVIVSL